MNMKYVIFGWGAGVAGAQLYTMNKVSFLRSRNIDVYLVYCSVSNEVPDADKVVLEPLRKIPSINVREMAIIPAYFTKRKREKVCKKILDFIDYSDGDDVFIESNDMLYSFWGELVAKKTGGRNFCFLLEGYFAPREQSQDFFRFKLSREEIAGTRKKSLEDLFAGDIQEENNCYFKAFCTNSVEKTAQADLKTILKGTSIAEYTVKIANVGRSTKPYVAYLPEEILKFAKQHPTEKILFVMIGGKEKEAPHAFDADLKSVPNLKVVFTGELFPIPETLLSAMDVCIASSGCVSVAFRAGAKTIGYLDDAEKPYGLVGYNEKEKLLLHELLEQVFFGEYCSRYNYDPNARGKCNTQVMEQEFSKQLSYMVRQRRREYYDTSQVMPKSKVYAVLARTIGRYVGLYSIYKIKNRMFGK